MLILSFQRWSDWCFRAITAAVVVGVSRRHNFRQFLKSLFFSLQFWKKMSWISTRFGRWKRRTRIGKLNFGDHLNERSESQNSKAPKIVNVSMQKRGNVGSWMLTFACNCFHISVHLYVIIDGWTRGETKPACVKGQCRQRKRRGASIGGQSGGGTANTRAY